MKRGIKTYLEIEFEGVELSNLEQIDVVFRQYKNGGAGKSALWRSDGSGDCRTGTGNSILVPWTRSETAQFAAGQPFWMDTRPVTTGGMDLETELVELRMWPGLFEEVEA